MASAEKRPSQDDDEADERDNGEWASSCEHRAATSGCSAALASAARTDDGEAEEEAEEDDAAEAAAEAVAPGRAEAKAEAEAEADRAAAAATGGSAESGTLPAACAFECDGPECMAHPP